MVISSTPALATTGATITGTVENTSVSPIAGICVNAELVGGGSGGSSSPTSSNGVYTVSGLATGSYTLFFDDCSGGNYVSAYYDSNASPTYTTQSFSSASGVGVTAGGLTTVSNDVELAAGATITGTVKNTSASTIAGICVEADPVGGGFGGFSSPTSSNGTYSVSGLATGNFTLLFSDCVNHNYASAYYDSGASPTYTTQSLSSASAVSVTAPNSTAVPNTVELAVGATITGTVENTSASPILGICVEADPVGGGITRSSLPTSSNGAYSVSGLATGSYTLLLYDCSLGTYVSAYYDSGASPTYATQNPSSASAVAVTAPNPTAVPNNVELATGATITGTVKDTSASTIAGICVEAVPVGGGFGGSSSPTSSNGVYTVSGLAAGNFTLLFSDCSSGNYASAYYYSGASPTYTTQSLSSATGVGVTAGVTTTVPNDVQLAAGATITGTVKDTSASTISGICVEADQVGGGISGFSSPTSSNGAYTVSGLAAGSYTLDFYDCSSGTYVSAYYDSSASPTYATSNFSNASAVAVTTGNATAVPDIVELAFSGTTSQSISLTSSAPTGETYGSTTPYTPTVSGGASGNPVTFSVDASSTIGTCSISSGVVSFTDAGTCVIDANQAGNSTYAAAIQVQQPVTVAKAGQSIGFTSRPPSSEVVGSTTPYTLSATGSASGNPVTFTVDASSTSGTCSISSGVVSFTDAGTCVIDANQAGNSNFVVAAQAQQSVTVTAAPATAPTPPPAPSGSISSSSASSTSTSGTATTTNDGVEVAASGAGSLTVSQYSGDPVSKLAFATGTSYFDIEIAPTSNFSSAKFTDCHLAGATTLAWYDPVSATWKPVKGNPGPTYRAGPPACVSTTLNTTTSPNLSQLTGTVFAATKALVPRVVVSRPTQVVGTSALAHLTCQVARCVGSIHLVQREVLIVHKGKKVTRKVHLVAVGSANFSAAPGHTEVVHILLTSFVRNELTRIRSHRLVVLDTILTSGAKVSHSTLLLIKRP